jgi:hypothetical protein
VLGQLGQIPVHRSLNKNSPASGDSSGWKEGGLLEWNTEQHQSLHGISATAARQRSTCSKPWSRFNILTFRRSLGTRQCRLSMRVLMNACAIGVCTATACTSQLIFVRRCSTVPAGACRARGTQGSSRKPRSLPGGVGSRPGTRARRAARARQADGPETDRWSVATLKEIHDAEKLHISFCFVWFGLVWLGFVWVRVGSFGFVWFRLVSLGFVWFRFVSLGFVWFNAAILEAEEAAMKLINCPPAAPLQRMRSSCCYRHAIPKLKAPPPQTEPKASPPQSAGHRRHQSGP